MSEIKEYKCPSCGSTLAYRADAEKLVCDSCGNQYEVDYIISGGKPETIEGNGFDWGSYKDDLDLSQNMTDNAVYVCESCGAQIETDKNTAATKCPFCGNNVILNDRLTGGLRPNAIIPFKVTPKQLPDVIKKFYEKKRLLPGNFFSNNVLGKVQGIYVPFWLFNCDVDGNVTYNAQRVLTVTDGEYRITTISFYVLYRDGEMRFEKVPVDASVKMDNDLMDSIEPFDYSELVDFNSGYLSGYLADRFDSDPDSELERATGRMITSTSDVMRESTIGYTSVQQRTSNLRAKNATVKYVLLPVYLLNCTYGGKQYRYAVNGQTGKVVGELPISRGKQFAWFGGIGAIVFAAAFLISMLL